MTFQRVTSAEDPLFVAAFALYEGSFPRYEQRLPEKQRAVMAHPLYHFDIITDEKDGFTGILLYWELSCGAYIEHFAIEPSLRGKALGSKVLETFCGERAMVILEIDPPLTGIAIRRECFYGRLGFKRNGYDHKHPAYQKRFLPHELVVMSRPRPLTANEYNAFNRELGEVVMKDAE